MKTILNATTFVFLCWANLACGGKETDSANNNNGHDGGPVSTGGYDAGPVVSGKPPCSSFSACGFPDETTAGVPSGTVLTEHTGNISIRDDGYVVDGWHIKGSFDIYANNVTIQNSFIESTNWWGVNVRPGATGIKILHCKIVGIPGQGADNGGEDYGVSSSSDGELEVGFNDISSFGAGVSLGHGNVHDNYLHDNQAFIPFDSSSPTGVSSTYVHSDPFISSGGSGLIVKHNTLIIPLSTTMGASEGLGLFDDGTPVTNTVADNNWIAGGAFAIYPGDTSSSGITIINNYVSTMYWPGGGVYGPVDTDRWHDGSGNSWSGNIWADGPNAGQTITPYP